jgi:uroporphyrinogen decarboxylase
MTTHRERLQACLAGEIIDRPPVALWRHFPVDDQSAESLAASTLLFQRTYDWDLVKVTPASSFCLKDYGSEDEWRGEPEGTRQYTRRVIQKPEDWEKLAVIPPTSPHLARQLACLRLLRSAIEPETPILQTIFDPLSQAKNLAGGERLVAHLRQNPEEVKKGLNAITGSTMLFIQEAIRAGIDGIFFAVQHAQAGLLSLDEFNTFGKQYDLQLMELANDLWLNMVHIHGLDIYFDAVAEYPAQILNWHDRETSPSLGKARVKKALCGGLRRDTVALGTPEQIQAEAQDALRATKGKRFILGTGCVVPVIAPHGNLMAVRKSVEAG